MAGAQFKFDASAVLAGLQKLRDRGGTPAPALRAFGEYLLSSHRGRFAQQIEPSGRAWSPLSEAYRARKRRNADKVLVLVGYLKGTLAYQVSDTVLRFGSNRIYAAVHQFGAKKGAFGRTRRGAPIPWGDVPARPFIGLSAADRAEGLRIITSYLASR